MPIRSPSLEHDDHPDAVLGSKLEAPLVTTEAPRRPMSIQQDALDRHAQVNDNIVNELDFNYILDTKRYPLTGLNSLQDVFSAVQYHQHLANDNNFANATNIKCLLADRESAHIEWVDDAKLQEVLNNANTGPEPGTDTPIDHSPENRKLLVIFAPLVPLSNTSYGSQTGLTKHATDLIFNRFNINPLYLLNLLGRPDYWAPQPRWEATSRDRLTACDFFCQHPRWNLTAQGAPLSAYVRYDGIRNQTVYIISHKLGDSNINALWSLLDIAVATTPRHKLVEVFLEDPFDIQVMLSTLSFETSKFHVKRFQRFMWIQINKVNDHLEGLEGRDRSKLGGLTKELQVISQNADSHLANADVAIITASGIKHAQARLHEHLPSNQFSRQRAADSIRYVIHSMEKQKIWFLNYKQRKDSTMTLVYNLVTQQDAASNISLAEDMKKDSTSMNAIAALTMTFLPGTFTASVLSAGIFSVIAGRTVKVSGMWWLWVAITVPLTVLVMVAWWIYKKKKTETSPASETVLEDQEILSSTVDEKKRLTEGRISFKSFNSRRRATGIRSNSEV